MKSYRFKAEYLDELALESGFTTMHYKIMLVLMTGKTYTQSQLAKKIGINHCQNLTIPLKVLAERGYIEVDRIEGRNKFLKAVLNRQADDIHKDQLAFTETAV